jgi:mRNA interferase MazF
MKRGDVAILNQPYSNGTGGKVRPVLVVSADRDNGRLATVIVATITRNISRAHEPTQLPIDRDSPEGRQAGLKATSAVVCANLFTAHKGLILKRIGSLPPAAMARIDACLKAALDLP